MSFYEKPVLNAPYTFPSRHWELDADGQPTNRLIESRRRSDLITPVPKAKKRKAPKGQAAQVELDLAADDQGLSTAEQQYDPTPIINELRGYDAGPLPSSTRRMTWRPTLRGSSNVSSKTPRTLLPHAHASANLHWMSRPSAACWRRGVHRELALRAIS